jgi:hypothetical protein
MIDKQISLICPICKHSMNYKIMPPAREGAILNFPFLLHCEICNKYYREVFKNTPVYAIEEIKIK